MLQRPWAKLRRLLRTGMNVTTHDVDMTTDVVMDGKGKATRVVMYNSNGAPKVYTGTSFDVGSMLRAFVHHVGYGCGVEVAEAEAEAVEETRTHHPVVLRQRPACVLYYDHHCQFSHTFLKSVWEQFATLAATQYPLLHVLSVDVASHPAGDTWLSALPPKAQTLALPHIVFHGGAGSRPTTADNVVGYHGPRSISCLLRFIRHVYQPHKQPQQQHIVWFQDGSFRPRECSNVHGFRDAVLHVQRTIVNTYGGRNVRVVVAAVRVARGRAARPENDLLHVVMVADYGDDGGGKLVVSLHGPRDGPWQHWLQPSVRHAVLPLHNPGWCPLRATSPLFEVLHRVHVDANSNNLRR